MRAVRIRSPAPNISSLLFLFIIFEMNYIICHYGEIALKGKNRKFFEEALVKNIKSALKPTHFEFVKRISGRIIVKLKKLPALPTGRQAGRQAIKIQKEIKERLSNVFGITYFAFAQNSKQEINEIKKKAFELLKDKKFKTFKISTKRSKKEFPSSSQEINEKVGGFILEKFTPRTTKKSKVRVDLKNPDITCFIELVEKYAFLYLEKIKGLGGLPVGVSGKAISLLSGGIDSPVASFLAMKRGLNLIFLHFHALPYTNKASIDKVKKIVETLNKFQPKLKLYLVPFAEIQKEILLKTPSPLRVIFYRRMMFRIAEKIAEKEKIKAIITGENLGQVASQTLENLKVIEKATNLLVLRPLIGEDKLEIIEKAKEIGTYDISILPYQDCCSRFLPEHPQTKANLEVVEKAERKLRVENLIKKALKDLKSA